MDILIMGDLNTKTENEDGLHQTPKSPIPRHRSYFSKYLRKKIVNSL